MLVLSRGEAGSAGTPEGREQESRKAARLIGASIEFLDFGGDCHLEYSPAKTRSESRPRFRRFKPANRLAPGIRRKSASGSCRGREAGPRSCRSPATAGWRTEIDAPHRVSSLFFYNITQHMQNPTSSSIMI